MKPGNSNPDEARVIGAYTVHPLRRYVPEMNMEAYERLKASIGQIGLINMIVVDKDWRIIDGRARARACVDLGVEDEIREPEIYQSDDIATYIAASVIRADYTPAQRAILAAHLMDRFERKPRRDDGTRRRLMLETKPKRANPRSKLRRSSEKPIAHMSELRKTP